MSDNISNQKLLSAINSGFDGVQKQFDGMQKQFDGVNSSLINLEKGQEDIQLRLTNVAYRFELQELQERVKMLEEKINK